MEIPKDRDARTHSAQIRQHLDHTLEHLKAGARQVDDPRAQALFETGAEVIQGLRTALDHYESRSEEVWR